MTEDAGADLWAGGQAHRLPRIALMGEFSAGKSTLANLLIGADTLPVQVVATQLPPVWIRYGAQPSMLVDVAGKETPCTLEGLRDLCLDDVAFIQLYCEAEILKNCEVIDMPGTSDPNMMSINWERMMPFVDGVLWCSPATQAWRQSEAALWEDVDSQVQAHSILVLTRADALLSAGDKAKVIARVRAEAGDAFAEIQMISLTQARDAITGEEPWGESGAEAFFAAFTSLLAALAVRLEDAPVQRPAARVRTEKANDGNAAPTVSTQAVVPRRPQLRRPKVRQNPVADGSTAQATPLAPKFS